MTIGAETENHREPPVGQEEQAVYYEELVTPHWTGPAGRRRPIMLVHGPQGFGKSHFILHKARELESIGVPYAHIDLASVRFHSSVPEVFAALSSHPQEYVGTTVGDTPQAGLFGTVTQNVCASENDTVLFAGRAPDLDAFLESLAYRSCLDRPLRVLFVATGLTILDDGEAMARLEEGNTTLVYASAIDPRWGSGDPSADAPPDYASFVNAFHEYGADPEAVPDVGDTTAFNNGYALVNHDAFAVAATAIRMTNRMDLDGGPPTASMVGAQLMLLNNAYRVPAGGGVLNYSDEYGGEAAGRYVPVVEMPLEGDLPLPDPYVIGAPGGP
ncbi:ATP-binding protein [Nocardiopsis sp. CA-288880]|uniref:ATP-binding protein n=1 Tax=Nocardiopsis sp. CA-288880 TaxID=3239995 RepID=UPI003D951736